MKALMGLAVIIILGYVVFDVVMQIERILIGLF